EISTLGTAPSPILHAFLVSQHTWHQRLRHPESDVLRRLVSNNVISCNKEKPPVLCHACQLGKHVRLPFFVWVYPLVRKSDVLSKFILFRNYVRTQFKCEIHAFQCDHGGEFDNRNLHDIFQHSWHPIPFFMPQDISTKSYREAFNDVNWHFAMRDEYNALIKNSTWTLVPRPPDVNVVRCMWIFRHKYLADGRLSRYKARLVANGSTQLEGVDVDETFSPIVKPGTIRTVLSLAASRHWPDVKNAFLHEDLSETVYMHQPPGFRDFTHLDYVCLLQHSLYGLKQAPRAWFQRFASYITRVRFHHSRCDSSLFIFHQGEDTAYLLLYVDDIVLTASSSDLLHRIISSLNQEFAMTDLGSLNYFLGVSVTRDSSGMFLSQKKYAVEILDRAGMVHCNPIRTPVDTESKLGTTGDVVSDLTLYRSLAGSLQYITFTRPDISYAVQQVCLHMHDPREPHFSALKRILRYVCGTLDYGLQLFSSSTTDLVAYSDADWADCPTTRRSTSGYCVFLGNNLLSWSAKRQPTLSRSSAEAEYRGAADVVLLRLVGYATYCVRVLHVPSRCQFADIFTKGLPTALFEEFRSSLSVRCPPAQTAGEC
ncbi:ribonuclease H-like domain-containing protein, partial [Tanacetum coccineum]